MSADPSSNIGTAPRPVIAALVVAAGRGVRAGGDVPKQYRSLGAESVLAKTLRRFAAHDRIGIVLPVIGPEDSALFDAHVPPIPGVLAPATGGETRQASVMNGLAALGALDQQIDFILVHDGARPFVSDQLIDRVIDGLNRAGLGDPDAEGVIPVLEVTDTVKRVDPNAGLIIETVDRAALRRVQTPQGFRFSALAAAHQRLAGSSYTDDAALLEALGRPVAFVTGEASNIKLTHPEDFMVEEAKATAPQALPRMGTGFDVHRFEPGDAVTLCGVVIPHDRRLAGHSDADVGLHALTDAILGAIGAGDIGDHFPPTDPQWKGAPSDRFLAHAAGLVTERGGRITHVDVTLICERPKIGPHRQAMRERIARILAIDPASVSVKATTTEGLGFTGRREGIAAQAAATVLL